EFVEVPIALPSVLALEIRTMPWLTMSWPCQAIEKGWALEEEMFALALPESVAELPVMSVTIRPSSVAPTPKDDDVAPLSVTTLPEVELETTVTEPEADCAWVSTKVPWS